MNNETVPIMPVPAGYSIRLPEKAFMAFLGAFVIFVFIPGVGRIVVRLWISRRLFLDDYFVLFAVLCLAPAAALSHTIQGQIYLQVQVGVGSVALPPDFYEQMLVFEKRIMIASCLVWAALYSIKFAFLIFMRKLVDRVEKLVIFWWVVVVITGLCGLASIPLGFIVCSHLTDDYLSYCPITSQLANERVYLIATTTMDVLTDVLIMILPLVLIGPLQLKLKRKLAVLAMMSLSVFMIAIAIVRCAGSSLPNGVIDTSWLVFWQGMESAVAVLMVSLLVLKTMFNTERDRSTARQRRLDAENGLISHSSGPTDGRRSWRGSANQSAETSQNRDNVQVYNWNPVESFAAPHEAHLARSSISEKSIHNSWRRTSSQNYSRPAYRQIHTEVTALPPTSPPQRPPTTVYEHSEASSTPTIEHSEPMLLPPPAPRTEHTPPTFLRDSTSSSDPSAPERSSSVPANPRLISRFFREKPVEP